MPSKKTQPERVIQDQAAQSVVAEKTLSEPKKNGDGEVGSRAEKKALHLPRVHSTVDMLSLGLFAFSVAILVVCTYLSYRWFQADSYTQEVQAGLSAATAQRQTLSVDNTLPILNKGVHGQQLGPTVQAAQSGDRSNPFAK